MSAASDAPAFIEFTVELARITVALAASTRWTMNNEGKWIGDDWRQYMRAVDALEQLDALVGIKMPFDEQADVVTWAKEFITNKGVVS